MRYKATPEFVAGLELWIDARARREFAPAEIGQKGERLLAGWGADAFAVYTPGEKRMPAVAAGVRRR